MAGRGRPPKPAAQRVGHRHDEGPLRVVDMPRAPQPALPDGIDWPERTREWWAMWRESALSAEFTANDWSELLDTALLHAELWRGNARVASELRLRVASFGATPADRARLRVVVADADRLDEQRTTAPGESARAKYGRPHAVPTTDPERTPDDHRDHRPDDDRAAYDDHDAPLDAG